MRKVAAEANIGAMTIYNYFDSKIALLHYIWNDFFEELLLQIQAALSTSRDAKTAIRAVCTTYINYWFEHPDRFRMVFLNEDRADENNTFFVEYIEAEKQIDALFYTLFEEAFSEKRKDEIKTIMHMTVCQMNGICLNLITISEFRWQSSTQLVEAYLDSILN